MLIVCTCCNFSSKWPYLQNSQDHSIEPKIYITDKDVSRRLVVMPCQKLALHNCCFAVKYHRLAVEYQLIIPDVKLLS